MEPDQSQVASSSRKPLSFPDLPFEIREQIFKDCDLLYDSSCYSMDDGTFSLMPFLIIALRPQPEAYRQALNLFYRLNAQLLNEWNSWSFPRGMTSNLIGTVQRLILYPNLTEGWCFLEDGSTIKRITPELIAAATVNATGVKEIDIRWDLDMNSNIYEMSRHPTSFTQWINVLSTAKTLTRVSTAFPLYPWSHYKEEREELSGSILAYVNKQVGVVARMTHIEEDEDSRCPKSHTRAEIWEWKAEPGKVMDWSHVRAKGHDTWYFWEQDVMLLEHDEEILVVPFAA